MCVTYTTRILGTLSPCFRLHGLVSARKHNYAVFLQSAVFRSHWKLLIELCLCVKIICNPSPRQLLSGQSVCEIDHGFEKSMELGGIQML